MKFRLFKQNKDKVVSKPKAVRKPKLRTPTSVLDKSAEEYVEELFVDWFNKALSDELKKGLSKNAAINHSIQLDEMPVRFAHLETRYVNKYYSYKELVLQPYLTKLMEGSNFKVENIYTGLFFANYDMVISWNVTHEQTKYAKEKGILDASILQKYELDDDIGFIEEFNELLSPSNKGNKYTCDYYNKEVKIALSNFSDKYIEVYNNIKKDAYRSCLYTRYVKLLRENGWYVDYRNQESDSKDTINCELILRAKTSND